MREEDGRGLAPTEIFSSAGAVLLGSCRWNTPVPSQEHGVYVVSMHRRPENGDGLATAPIDYGALEGWLDRCPGLALDSGRPDIDELAAHLATWWLPNTSILYIGKAETQSLRKRVGQYHKTPLGAPRPQGGGYWLKTLGLLGDLYLHYSEVASDVSAGGIEDDLLNAFLSLYSAVPETHPEPDLPLPWANLQVERPPPRRRRDHRLPSLANQQRPMS